MILMYLYTGSLHVMLEHSIVTGRFLESFKCLYDHLFCNSLRLSLCSVSSLQMVTVLGMRFSEQRYKIMLSGRSSLMIWRQCVHLCFTCCLHFADCCLAYTPTLKMEVGYSCETSANLCRIKPYYIPEDSTFRRIS